MKIEEIYRFLDAISPFELQESWDNSGLNVGSLEDEIEHIIISLDIDGSLAKTALPKTLFITHHPLIFKSLKKIDGRYPSNIIKELIRKECALISMHTNVDKTHLNKFVVGDILGQKEAENCDFVSYFDVDMSFEQLAEYVKNHLKCESVKTAKAKDSVKRVAFCVGSGGDMIDKVDADCFISGDFKYHHALNANENGISLIDVGHYESERFFPDMLFGYLKDLPINVIIKDCKNPFEYK